MIGGLEVRAPRIEEHISLASLVGGWLTAQNMIPENVLALLRDVAVVAYSNGIPIAFMATTQRIRHLQGITAELGAMVKDPSCQCVRVGEILTRYAVAAEKQSGKSEQQFAFATSPSSEHIFRIKCNAPELQGETLSPAFFLICDLCPKKKNVTNGRRCCAAAFDLTAIDLSTVDLAAISVPQTVFVGSRRLG